MLFALGWTIEQKILRKTHVVLNDVVPRSFQIQHTAVFLRRPVDEALRFELRHKNVEMVPDKAAQAQARATRLEEMGAFRILLNPLTGFKA